MDAADLLLTEVHELVHARGIDSPKDASDLEQLVTQAEEDYLRRSDAGLVPPLIDPKGTHTYVFDSMAGLGPLQDYLDDESIEEIWVNVPGRVFVAHSGRPELTTTILGSEDLAVPVERMPQASGRRLDLSSPFVDAQLAGGQRLHAIIPPITSQHWTLNIRKHTSHASRAADFVHMGSLTSRVAALLDAFVQTGLSILVSGAIQAGKATMVRALAGAVPDAQRAISCEEVSELALRNRDCVAMQTRPPNLEGVGEISLRRLVEEALRMCPDHLLIGEVRKAEALDLLIAMNSGLPSMYTIHANSAREAVIKIRTLPLLAGENVSSDFVVPTAANAIDLVVHPDLDRSGRRTAREVTALSGQVENGIIELSNVFHRDPTGNFVRGAGAPDAAERFNRAGHNLTALLNSCPAGPQEAYRWTSSPGSWAGWGCS